MNASDSRRIALALGAIAGAGAIVSIVALTAGLTGAAPPVVVWGIAAAIGSSAGFGVAWGWRRLRHDVDELRRDKTQLERQLADHADELDRSETMFRSVFERAPVGMTLISPDGRYLKANETFARMLGYSVDEVCQRTCAEMTHPEDRLCSRQAIEQLLRGDISVDRLKKRYVGSGGRVVWAEVTSRLQCNEAGLPDYIISQAVDITEQQRALTALRQSEDRFRSLFANAPIGVYRSTPDGRVLYANPALLRMLGYTSLEELSGVDLAESVYTFEYPRSEFRRRIEREGAVAGVEAVWKRRDGDTIIIRENAKVVRDTDGNVLYYEGTVEDITERRRAESEKAELTSQLQHAQKLEAIGQLAGSVAHDFNNILTAILGNVELLRDDFARRADDDEQGGTASSLEQIEHAAQRAAELTQRLLAFGRRQRIKPRLLDLNVVLDDMERMLRRLIHEDVSLKIVKADELDLVRADPGQLEQVVLNLALNAGDAMPSGGELTLTTRKATLSPQYVQTHAEAQPGPHVLLTVRDTGCGMDGKTFQRMFDPFFTTKPVGHGTGLGLATVRNIVRQAGGHITAQSTPGEGTMIQVYLPVASVPVFEPEPDAAVTEATGSETILVCEDDAPVRGLAAKALQYAGYHVLTADSGDRAVELAKAHHGPIDMLLTDIVMPGMNGREVAEQLATVRPSMRTLFMSGYPANVLAPHGELDEDIALLEKPFTSPGLRQRVRELLDSAPARGH